MDNLPLEPNEAAYPDGKPDKELLSEYVKNMETDENLEELARKLGIEWRESPQAKPDLSFSKFEKKTKPGNQ